MKETFKLYFSYLKESFLEVKNNLSIFGIYILGLVAVIIVNHYVDQTYAKSSELKIVGKILFSLVPILIISKLLYVMKIRISGSGDYRTVMANFLVFNILYSGLVLIGLLLYLVPAFVLHYWLKSNLMFLWASLFIIPFLYFLIFYSLTPFIAVFEENRLESFFKQSRALTRKNILMVVLNHFFAWLPNVLYIAHNYFNVLPETRSIIVLSTAVPEAVFQLVTIITTVKIYFYLLNLDASYD